MEDVRQTLSRYSSRNLEQRKHWYSPAAVAYDRFRPGYPQGLIQQMLAIAALPARGKILEVGCGPATATVAFAALGYSLLCLEPNPDFYQLAQHNCRDYPRVKIQNTSFEAWPVQVGEFDAVLAATSFHWIPPHIGYPKAARALQEKGLLILLWNHQLQPNLQVHQLLNPVYQEHAPWLGAYEMRATQEQILFELGQVVLDSGEFQDLVAGQVTTRLTYNAADYLALLETYSPYLELHPPRRQALLAGLRQRLDQELGGRIELTYLSAFHLARKKLSRE